MNLLPVGTVVNLKNEEDFPLMIIGKMPIVKSKENKFKYFDYKALAYPVGDIGEDEYFCFNEEDIEKIVYNGYQSEDNIKFDAIIYSLKKMKEAQKISSSQILKKSDFSSIDEKGKEIQRKSSTNRLSN